MNTLRKFFQKSNIDAEVAFDEPMAAHTTLRIGGPADAFARPRSVRALGELIEAAREEGIALAVMGGGANLLVADKGVRGIVAATGLLVSSDFDETGTAKADAGLAIAELARRARDRSLSGLEFAAGLPGSVGGAVYMNARCYDREMADALESVDYLEPGTGALRSAAVDRAAWAYKRTPFMPGGALSGAVIVGARFRLAPGDPSSIGSRMAELEADRASKGHFDYPSAGSMFKNDRSLGRPTGRLLDELGFRGRRVGDAMVSPRHANIFVNAGAATAADMLALVREAQAAALERFGAVIEPEVVLLGEF